MTLPWNTSIAGATRLPVQIDGGWTEGGARPGVICTWRGTAGVDEEVVAVLVAEHFGAVGWSRSRRTPPHGLELALHCYLPDRPDFRPWVLVETGEARLLWQAPWPGGSGLDLVVGGPTETGRLLHWAQTRGRDDPARFGVLLLAKRDVRFGRKRIWRARVGVGAAGNPLDLVLRGPRWGWDPPTPPA